MRNRYLRAPGCATSAGKVLWVLEGDMEKGFAVD